MIRHARWIECIVFDCVACGVFVSGECPLLALFDSKKVFFQDQVTIIFVLPATINCSSLEDTVSFLQRKLMAIVAQNLDEIGNESIEKEYSTEGIKAEQGTRRQVLLTVQQPNHRSISI